MYRGPGRLSELPVSCLNSQAANIQEAATWATVLSLSGKSKALTPPKMNRGIRSDPPKSQTSCVGTNFLKLLVQGQGQGNRILSALRPRHGFFNSHYGLNIAGIGRCLSPFASFRVVATLPMSSLPQKPGVSFLWHDLLLIQVVR